MVVIILFTCRHSFGERFSTNDWYREIAGQREFLHRYAGVPRTEIRGMRAPFLQIGGDQQFQMLMDANFTYDSSISVFDNSPPLWPYTLDFAIQHECMITPCPSRSYPGKQKSWIRIQSIICDLQACGRLA